MHTISDDDLVLYHYRDGLDAARIDEIRDALAASANLRERYASLERVLARVDAEPEPEPDADFSARLWQKLEPRLPTRRVERRRDPGERRRIETVAVVVEDEILVADRVHASTPSGSNAPRSLRTARKIACLLALSLSESASEISSIDWPS